MIINHLNLSFTIEIFIEWFYNISIGLIPFAFSSRTIHDKSVIF